MRVDVIVGASHAQLFDLGLAPETLKGILRAFPLGLQYKRHDLENKPAGSLVVLLRQIVRGMPRSLCGRQAVGPSSLPAAVARSN